MRPGASRDATLPDGLARQAHGVLPPGLALRRARIAAARRRVARRPMRLYPQNNVAEKRLAVHAAIFRSRRSARCSAERLHGDFVFLDIGASVGGYALFVAAHGGPRARILAVEPLPEDVRAPRLQHRPERLRQRQGGLLRPGRPRRRDHAVRQAGNRGRDLGAHRRRGGERRAIAGAGQEPAVARCARRATSASTRSSSTSKAPRIWCSSRFFAMRRAHLWPRLIIMEFALLRGGARWRSGCARSAIAKSCARARTSPTTLAERTTAMTEIGKTDHRRRSRHRRRNSLRPHQGPQHRLYRRISSTRYRRRSARGARRARRSRRRSSPR